jgi:hypothetical protein
MLALFTSMYVVAGLTALILNASHIQIEVAAVLALAGYMLIWMLLGRATDALLRHRAWFFARRLRPLPLLTLFVAAMTIGVLLSTHDTTCPATYASCP